MKGYPGKNTNEDDDQAQAWLRDALKDGPLPAAEVFAQAKANGFTQKMTRRAFHALKCIRKKPDFKGGSFWMLPSSVVAHSTPRESSASSQKHEISHERAQLADRESSASSQKHEISHERDERAELAHGQGRESSDDDEWGEV
jgi:hypothetical protein